MRTSLLSTDPGLKAGVFFFVMAIAYLPFTDDPSTTLRYALMAVAACAALWVPVTMRLEHWFGLALLAYAAASLSWAMPFYDGVHGLLDLVFFAAFFVIGGALPSMRSVYIGLGYGMAINSAFAIAQWFGFHGIFQAPWTGPGGLFVNKDLLAEPAVLAFVGLVAWRQLWLAAAVAPSIILTESRTALVAIIAAAIGWLWTQSRFLALLILVTFTAVGTSLVYIAMHNGDGGIIDRLLIWSSTIRGLTPLGSGIGSFFATFPAHSPDYDTLREWPAHAHSDFLELAYELGAVSVLYVAVLAVALMGPFGPERLVLFAFIAEECFGFALHRPVTACIAAVVAGHLAAARDPLRRAAYLRRNRICAGLEGFA